MRVGMDAGMDMVRRVVNGIPQQERQPQARKLGKVVLEDVGEVARSPCSNDVYQQVRALPLLAARACVGRFE